MIRSVSHALTAPKMGLQRDRSGDLDTSECRAIFRHKMSFLPLVSDVKSDISGFYFGVVVSMARTAALQADGCGFESHRFHIPT